MEQGAIAGRGILEYLFDFLEGTSIPDGRRRMGQGRRTETMDAEREAARLGGPFCRVGLVSRSLGMAAPSRVVHLSVKIHLSSPDRCIGSHGRHRRVPEYDHYTASQVSCQGGRFGICFGKCDWDLGYDDGSREYGVGVGVAGWLRPDGLEARTARIARRRCRRGGGRGRC